MPAIFQLGIREVINQAAPKDNANKLKLMTKLFHILLAHITEFLTTGMKYILCSQGKTVHLSCCKRRDISMYYNTAMGSCVYMTCFAATNRRKTLWGQTTF